MSTVRRRAGRLTHAVLLLVGLGIAGLFLVPKLLGHDMYVITTGSMAGTVDPGALVVSERVPATDLAVGDVITFLPPPDSGVDHLVTHRIAKVAPDRTGALSFTTRGDANPSDDPWTFTVPEGVQARMLYSVPAVGRPVLWLADPGTRRLALGLPALLIALVAAGDVVRTLRTPRRPEDVEPVADAPSEPVAGREPVAA